MDKGHIFQNDKSFDNHVTHSLRSCRKFNDMSVTLFHKQFQSYLYYRNMSLKLILHMVNKVHHDKAVSIHALNNLTF